jgi:2-polyprenyl-3-methyl-5-hydroxy-6-metoxy-1,4-benzoquinol methylase
MDSQTIVSMKNEVVSRYGPWHAHNLHLQDDIYTIGPAIVGDEVKLRRIVQCVLDLTGAAVDGLRVLDLACNEGLYAIEFARRKANVVGIEGREANIEKARFVKRVLSLENLELVQDDVRNLSAERYGQFDVVLCLGLLYHLDASDLFPFVGRLAEVCRKVCIVDTRITLHPNARYSSNGETIFGTWGEEHDPSDSKETKASRLWASLDNNNAFWLSRPTIYNLLSGAGFTSVYECNVPAEPKKPANRITFVAIKGEPCDLLTAPLIAARPRDEMPECPFREHGAAFDLLRQMSHLLPRKIRTFGRRLLGLPSDPHFRGPTRSA